VEGWTNTSATWSTDGTDGSAGVFMASTTRAYLGTYSLAIGHKAPDVGGGYVPGAFSAGKVHLCPSGVGLDLSAKSFSLAVYLDPTTVGGTVDELDSEFFVQAWNGQNQLSFIYLDGGMSLPAGSWFFPSVSLSGFTSSVTDLEIVFRTYNQAWVGTVYFDNIRIQ
jgi:hypothetical protein